MGGAAFFVPDLRELAWNLDVTACDVELAHPRSPSLPSVPTPGGQVGGRFALEVADMLLEAASHQKGSQLP